MSYHIFFIQVAKSVQRLMVLASASANLIVYCATSVVFRKELFGCINRRRARRISDRISLVTTETVEMPLRGVREQD